MRAALLSAAALVAGCAPTAATVAADPPPRRQHAEPQPMPDTTPHATTIHPSRSRARTSVGGGDAAAPRPARTPAGNTALVSWYAQGSRTANGQRFNPDNPTFAHRTMPFGTRLRFCADGRCVEAVCTDRGPYIGGRTFDLSRGAFAALAPLSRGVLTITWEAA